MTTSFFIVLLASSVFVVLLIPRLPWEIWGINLPNLPEFSYVECLLLAFVALASW
jgi:hypothetical protein